MPKKLNSDWREELGEKHDDVHRLWLNSLANLTLISKSSNSQIGNSSFADKKGELRIQPFKKLNDAV